MKVVWVNPNEPVELPHHRCSVCKKEGAWVDGWIAQVKGYGWHDFYFITCSDKCREEDENNGLSIKYFKEMKKHYE